VRHRRRSHSDGAKDFDLQALKAELAAIEKAGQNSRHAAIKKPSSRKALDQSSILHSGYVLRKNGAGKAKGKPPPSPAFALRSSSFLV